MPHPEYPKMLYVSGTGIKVHNLEEEKKVLGVKPIVEESSKPELAAVEEASVELEETPKPKPPIVHHTTHTHSTQAHTTHHVKGKK